MGIPITRGSETCPDCNMIALSSGIPQKLLHCRGISDLSQCLLKSGTHPWWPQVTHGLLGWEIVLLSHILRALTGSMADCILGHGNRGSARPWPWTLHSQPLSTLWVVKAAPCKLSQTPTCPCWSRNGAPGKSQTRSFLQSSPVGGGGLPSLQSLARCHGSGGSHASLTPCLPGDPLGNHWENSKGSLYILCP